MEVTDKAVHELHGEAMVIDGLIIAKWERQVFEDMRLGGLSAANCTCSVWEGFTDTMDNIAEWKRMLAENDDILLQVYGVEDIRRAKQEGRVGIILGWQNTFAIESELDRLRLFRDLGVRFMQLTYNTQNLVGAGCWESKDNGLTDYGRDVVERMNELGIVIDLSHVGEQTCRDAVAHSKVPVAFTHCVPRGLLDMPRNKSDDLLISCADSGGFVGFAPYGPFLPTGEDSTIDDCVAGIEYTIDLVGEDAVGIGTDFTQGHDADFFTWLRSDKGNGRSLVKGFSGRPTNPAGLDGMKDYPNLTATMLRRGWSENRVRKVMGENWLRYLGEVWGD
jgi:membrane dipeptidase